MEERKEIKISLSTLLLFIAIILIAIMGFFLYKLNDEKTSMILTENNLKAKVAELENKTEINTENETQTIQMSFSETMNMLYTKNGVKIGENDYNITPSDSIYMINEDVSGNIINVEHTDIIVNDGEIYFNMNKVEPDKNINTSIEGINEEIVSIKIIQVEGGATPSAVYLLTRNGNVYYINEEMINSDNFVAKKLTNLKEIVSIEIADTVYSGAMEGSTTLIATTYNGEKIDILEDDE